MKIALTYTGEPEKHINYVACLQDTATAGGLRPEILRLSAEDNNMDALADCQGLVLSGGLDFHPRYYQGQTGYAHQPDCFDEARDAFEIGCYQMALAAGMPVLGICRGLQLINCVHGGTLVQDIGLTANAIHKFDRQDKAHAINIETGSLLHQITGYNRGVVNSAHHQVIKTLGAGLSANCHSDDGWIEGIEWTDKTNRSFLLGVQWHPERLFKLNLHHSALSLGLRHSFVDAVKKYSQHANH